LGIGEVVHRILLCIWRFATARAQSCASGELTRSVKRLKNERCSKLLSSKSEWEAVRGVRF
jgi:hypothetical protein